MNNFLIDLLPVFLFFLAFKYYGIYTATWVGIVVTGLQTVISRLVRRRWDKVQLMTLAIFIIFGGMTLYLHNPIFVKWKPTIVFWVFALALFASHFFGKKTFIQRILEGALNKAHHEDTIAIPLSVGNKLNAAWALFFIMLGAVNLYVAYTYDDAVWVNFKLYGITCATLLFSILQSAFLTRFIKT
jgi:intracellular septation protein